VPVPKQDVFEFMKAEKGFQLPSVNLLENPEIKPASADDENLRMQSILLEKKLEDFGVQGKVATILPGPVITTFEYEPAPGIKISKIVGLTDDLALALRSISIRIVAPIPGKAAIGIELPNETRETVRLKEIIISTNFEKSKSKLTICLGKDIIGNPVVAELDKMPHLLIAGATGTGKSVALNAMICSFLFKANPDEVKLIMIDPKRIELSSYDGIPHLITPVVTDVKKATNALFWAVHEMEQRYKLLSEKKARNITQYNQKIDKEKEKTKEENSPEKLPYVVIIIDELADLMVVASRDVEVALTRLAQMARAAGIHLILATQRPSVDVLTGIIKANFPTRLSFQVSSKTDSRTIIDTNGAENLLGNGDMLFLPPGTAKIQRIHGAYISEEEISGITEFLKKQKTPEYDHAVITESEKEKVSSEDLEYDEKYDEAIALITKTGQASISMIQRHLRIGYNRAARIIEIMEKEGVVGPSDGVKPREVLVRSYDKMP
jgi:S-DNA-T family DNA segregation ATPase FtsK/SpoIIIE